MKLFAKASPTMSNIKEKIRCGCDGIEFNLTDDFYVHGHAFRTHYDHAVFTSKNIEVVHTPHDADGYMMNLEKIFMHRDLQPLEDVFALAQYCAGIWKHRILVVIHTSLSYFDFMEFEILRDRMEETLTRYFERYPEVDLAIENVVPMEYKPDAENPPFLCNGCFTDVVRIVEYFRERFGERVGSVLDICHAEMTEKYMKILLGAAGFLSLEMDKNPEQIDYSMDHYFRMNHGICKLIHFNDFQANGYQKNHGTPFATQEKVDSILDLYKRYGYTCPLTLEIREEDYSDCVNYRKTKAFVEDWMQRNL